MLSISDISSDVLVNYSEILLAARWRVFGDGKLEQRLHAAFESFHTFCKSGAMGKAETSSLNKFELKTFKMQSQLGNFE